MADVTLNVSKGNRKEQPSKRSPRITLTSTQVPVFLVFGDSLSTGFCNVYGNSGNQGGSGGDAIKLFRNIPQNQILDVTALSMVPSIAKVWNKYQRNTSGETMDRSDAKEHNTANLPSTTTPYGFSFADLDPRFGGGNVADSFEFDDFEEVNRLGGPSPLWTLATELYGLFVDADDEPVLPHFIYMGIPSSRITNGGTDTGTHLYGSICWTSDTSATTSNVANINDLDNPPRGTAYEHYMQFYVAPALKALQDASKDPIMCGCFGIVGGNDTSTSLNTALINNAGQTGDAWDVAASLIGDLKDDICTRIGIPDIPWVGYLPFRPLDEVAGTFDGYQPLRDDLITLFSDTMNWAAYIDPETFERDTVDGIHFTVKGYISFYKAMAAAYKTILARKDVVVTGYDVTATVT